MNAKSKSEQNISVFAQKYNIVNGNTNYFALFYQLSHSAPFIGRSIVKSKPKKELKISIFVQKWSIYSVSRPKYSHFNWMDHQVWK